MRTFDHFPVNAKCPICGTNEDKEALLVKKAGTSEGNICEAEPVHSDCLTDNLWLYPGNRPHSTMIMAEASYYKPKEEEEV